MGVIIVIAIIAIVIYLVVKATDEKNQTKVEPKKSENAQLMDVVHKLGTSNNANYWEGFQRRKPIQAKEIETLTGRDLSKSTDAEAFEIVNTLLRWSSNTGVPIKDLKSNFLSEVEKLLDGNDPKIFIERLKEEKAKEAKEFNISIDNTITAFMQEWLIEEQENNNLSAISKKIADRIGIPDNQFDEWQSSINNTVEELNLAPDISKLDREENKLFHLANEGVEMFDNLSVKLDSEPLRLSNAGKVEARILCSTMVMDLHSNFKNEIDLDIQADRYFLLLADGTTFSGCEIDDEISFINSRIAFYKKECTNISNMKALQLFNIDNALGRIFNALYLHPLSDCPETINRNEISPHELVMFKARFEKVKKALERGRARITGDSNAKEDELLQEAGQIFESLIPIDKRSMLNQDVAWLLSDQMKRMILDGKIDGDIANILPADIKINTKLFISKLNCSGLSDENINDILEDAQQQFINKFNK